MAERRSSKRKSTRKGESANLLSAIATRHRGRIAEKIAAMGLFGKSDPPS